MKNSQSAPKAARANRAIHAQAPKLSSLLDSLSLGGHCLDLGRAVQRARAAAHSARPVSKPNSTGTTSNFTGNSGKIANAREVQTCADTEDIKSGRVKLKQSRSPFDRAHQQRDVEGLLVPSARKVGRVARVTVQHSTPRLYPAYYANVEEQCDQLHETRRRLNGVPGIGLRSSPTAAEQVQFYLSRLKEERGYEGARDFTRGDVT